MNSLQGFAALAEYEDVAFLVSVAVEKQEDEEILGMALQGIFIANVDGKEELLRDLKGKIERKDARDSIDQFLTAIQ